MSVPCQSCLVNNPIRGLHQGIIGQPLFVVLLLHPQGLTPRFPLSRASLTHPIPIAARCLEQLFEYLELNLANRVAAKVGSKQQLELVRAQAVKCTSILAGLRGSEADTHEGCEYI